MKTQEAANLYYGGQGLEVSYLIAVPWFDDIRAEKGLSDKTRVEQVQGPILKFRPELDPDPQLVKQSMREIAKSLRVIEYGGSQFEVGFANDDVDSDEYMLHISTYSSAISTNHGNGRELAEQAVRYPNKKHLYIASFGNGSSLPLLPEDRKYVKQTGRFTKDVDDLVVPIKSISNLHAALEKNNFNVTRLMGTDSAGGHYARALGITMESGQLSHAFFSETSGFVNLSTLKMIKGMLYTEGSVNAGINKSVSPDPHKLTDEMIAEFTKLFEEYADLPNRVELAAKKAKLSQTLGSMLTSLSALKRGPVGDKNPLVDDTDALIIRHPNAKLTYGVAEHDPLYESPENSRKASTQFLQSITIGKAPVKVALIPGMSHAYNTHFPGLYHDIKRRALDLWDIKPEDMKF